MPHTTVGVHNLGIRDDFGDWKVDIVSVAYAHCDATVSSKCSMNLPKQVLGVNLFGIYFFSLI